MQGISDMPPGPDPELLKELKAKELEEDKQDQEEKEAEEASKTKQQEEAKKKVEEQNKSFDAKIIRKNKAKGAEKEYLKEIQ